MSNPGFAAASAAADSASQGCFSLGGAGGAGSEGDSRSGLLGVSASDLQCPICVDTIRDAFVTSCGHTFCHACLQTHLRNKRSCPSCSAYLTAEQCYPNFLLSKILHKASSARTRPAATLPDYVQQLLGGSGDSALALSRVKLPDLDAAIELLKERRQLLTHQQHTSKLLLLLAFLNHAKQTKERQVVELQAQLHVLGHDMHKLQQQKRRQQRQQQQQQQQQHQGTAPGAWSHGGSSASSGGGSPVRRLPARTSSVIILNRQAGGAAATAAAVAAAAAARPEGQVHVHRITADAVNTITIQKDQMLPGAMSDLAQPLLRAWQQQQQQQHEAASYPALYPGTQVAAAAAGSSEGIAMRHQQAVADPAHVYGHPSQAAPSAAPSGPSSASSLPIGLARGLAPVAGQSLGMGRDSATTTCSGCSECRDPVCRARAAAVASAAAAMGGAGVSGPGQAAAGAAHMPAQQQELLQLLQAQRSCHHPEDGGGAVRQHEPCTCDSHVAGHEGSGSAAQALGMLTGTSMVTAAAASASGVPAVGTTHTPSHHEHAGLSTCTCGCRVAFTQAGHRHSSGTDLLPSRAAAPSAAPAVASAAATATGSLAAVAAMVGPSAGPSGGRGSPPVPSPALGAMLQTNAAGGSGLSPAILAQLAAGAGATSGAAVAGAGVMVQGSGMRRILSNGRMQGGMAAPAAQQPGALSTLVQGQAQAHAKVQSQALVQAQAQAQAQQAAQKRKMISQFDELEGAYFQLRRQRLTSAADALMPSSGATDTANGASHPAAAAGPTAGPHITGGPKANGALLSAGAALMAPLEVHTPSPSIGTGGQELSTYTPTDTADQALDLFSEVLSTATHSNRLSILAEMCRPSSAAPQPGAQGQAAAAAPSGSSGSIISSIEFNLDESVFAAAGVSARISVYNYASILSAASAPAADLDADMDDDDLPMGRSRGRGSAGPRGSAAPVGPTAEICTRSKLTCLSYSKAVQQHLIAGDYNGVVTLWDVETKQSVMDVDGHDRRIWSVDFCSCPAGDPTTFLSGSDDCTVKVWSTRHEATVSVLNVRANVCSVRFNPWDPHQVAVGSAAHLMHLYDLRYAQQPLATFAGHSKAVSYVRFLSRNEVVTASTDNTLRLWDSSAASSAISAYEASGRPGAPPQQLPGSCLRTFSGHQNERNFVGLSVDAGQFIACGSESNQVYLYYKAIATPSTCFSLAQNDAAPRGTAAGASSSRGFISALSWRQSSHTLVAANSQGRMVLLGMDP